MYSSSGNDSSHLPGSSGAAAAPKIPTVPYPFRSHHQQVHHSVMIPLPFTPSADDDDFPRKDERFPQWGVQETRDFIEIRAQLEWGFSRAKRNKNLWGMVADRMREKGYRRTSEQCKYKWKNLAARYKEQETSNADTARPCPFFSELHSVFTARANRMQQAHVEDKTVLTKQRKRPNNDQSQKEIEEDDDEEERELENAGKGTVVPNRKASKEKLQKTRENENCSNDGIVNALQEIMRDFIAQQRRIDAQWRESMEKRAEEREAFEQEWRQKMEKLERERLATERAWRERDEQRKLRDERRVEKRDALLTILLNKLISEGSS